MNADDVKQICVVGSGTMGSQIAAVAALAGYSVTLNDTTEEALAKAVKSNRGHLEGRVSKSKMSQEDMEAALGRIKTSTSLEEAASNADLVIEAVFEDLEVKRQIFAKLDKICPAHTILATNSSTIVISKIVAGNVERKAKCANMHFFHPVLVMRLVEVVKGPDTSEETAEIVMEVGRRFGKEAVLLKKEINGFLVNYILGHLNAAALHLYAEGYASYEDIDKAVKAGLNHPMGPFELMDFSGVDVVHFVQKQKYKETGDPQDKPYEFLDKMVEEGRVGRKAGRGFYDYNK
jgi:3-hydroxybutyryl-CoA dehydrogenase